MTPLKFVNMTKSKIAEFFVNKDVVAIKNILETERSIFDDLPAYLFEQEMKLKILELGIDSLVSQIESMPVSADKFLFAGVLFYINKEVSEALQCYSQGLELSPNDPMLCHFAGVACVEKGLFKEALELFSIPKNAALGESSLLEGYCHNSLKKYELAYDAYDLGFSQLNNDESLLVFLGFIRDRALQDRFMHWGYLQRLRCLDQEYKGIDESLDLQLGLINADVKYATAEFSQAASLYQSLMLCQPNNQDIRLAQGHSLLLSDKVSEACDLHPELLSYRNRDNLPEFKSPENVSRWQGMSLESKSLILYCNEPLSGSLFSLRYIKKLLSDYKITKLQVYVDARLVNVLSRSFYEEQKIVFLALNSLSSDENSSNLANFDYYCFSSDLFAYLGAQLLPNRFTEPFLSINKEVSNSYKNKLNEAFPDKIILGICWKSNEPDLGTKNDFLLGELGSLFSLQGVQWVSLQTHDSINDIQEIERLHGVSIVQANGLDAGEDLDQWLSLAGALDGVVCLSDGLAHLLGASGIPSNVAVPISPQWFWLSTGRNTPWYPNHSLFRQTTFNSWTGALDSLVSGLSQDMKGVTSSVSLTLGEAQVLFDTARYQRLIELAQKFSLAELSNPIKSFYAHALFKQGAFDECLAIVKPMLDSGVVTDHNLLLMAMIGRVQKKFSESLTLLKSVKDEGFVIDVTLESLHCAIGMKQYDQAYECWDALIKRDPSTELLDKLTHFLMDQREWIKNRSSMPEDRWDFCWHLVETFDNKLGSRNPVAPMIIKSDLLGYKGHNQQAIDLLRSALTLRPELAPQISSSLGYHLLCQGEFREGFTLNSYRHTDDRLTNPSAISYDTIPWITTENYVNDSSTTLMITGEQGIGDQLLNLQFLRKFLKSFKGQIVLRVHKKILELTRRSFPDIAYIGSESRPVPDEFLKKVTCKLLTGDIPHFILDDFEPYCYDGNWLVADPEKINFFKHKLRSQFGNKTLVGLSWRSASGTWGASKDVSLNSFMPLFKAQNIQCISLQYGDVANEVNTLESQFPGALYHESSFNITDDVDSAVALVAALDHVVTVSNVNAHYAGNLGVKGTVLLKAQALWHWQKDCEHVPWYPSLTLKRVDSVDSVHAVIDQYVSDTSKKNEVCNILSTS